MMPLAVHSRAHGSMFYTMTRTCIAFNEAHDGLAYIPRWMCTLPWFVFVPTVNPSNDPTCGRYKVTCIGENEL